MSSKKYEPYLEFCKKARDNGRKRFLYKAFNDQHKKNTTLSIVDEGQDPKPNDAISLNAEAHNTRMDSGLEQGEQVTSTRSLFYTSDAARDPQFNDAMDLNPEAYLDFVNNDYLNLRRDPRLLEAAFEYGSKYGVGSGSSRLLNFTLPIYGEFEQEIAKDKRKEEALIMGSGYQTNATVLSSLMDKRVLNAEPLVFCDRLNHASIHHACRLAGISQIRYDHCDLRHLEHLLEQNVDAGSGTRMNFIITESLFSMDGDATDLKLLAELGRKYNAFIYIDEAHATGVFGYGLTSLLPQEDIDCFDVIMGTFSKALGSFGGYIATSKVIKEYLVNACTGLIYSTALPPIIIGAARKAWEIVGRDDMRRRAANLIAMAEKLRRALKANGWHLINGNSQIIALTRPPKLDGTRNLMAEVDNTGMKSADCGNRDEANWSMATAKRLREEKHILVAPIRPPTVQTSRIRINLSLNHSNDDIKLLIEALGKAS